MASMSEHPVDAKTVEAQAVKWLIERDETQAWTDEKQQAFDAWLAESPAHQTAFWRVEASWSRTELIADLRPFGLRVQRIANTSRPWFKTFRLAAAISVFAAIGVSSALYFSQPETQTFSTSVGGHKIITLRDGSQIELNTNTTVEVGTGSNERTVKLIRGEAFFQVHHDATRVFTVTSAGHRVTDLGTKFVMRANGQNLQVSLLEGSASLETIGVVKGEPLILKPGDVAVATGRSIALERKPAQQLSEELAWRKGLLIFDDTTLADAVAEFNRYNAERIVIQGMSGEDFKLNGAIRINDREEFARIARNLFGLKVDERDSETIIRR